MDIETRASERSGHRDTSLGTVAAAVWVVIVAIAVVSLVVF
ncbi:hypothetical protein ACFO4E_06365 [Nocardiopsis mangrovi]|uniref:Uncharacterized protein n=1 Tax=Nocardiopsis mangrovi TaxID=1179818 RepID=A0ABV9DS08_9ACTN